MRRWIWGSLAIIGLSLALSKGTVALTTLSGYEATITLGSPNSTAVVEGRPYILHLQFVGTPRALSQNVLASIVDMVVGWADSNRVAEGHKGCVLEVSAELFANGTLGGVWIKHCKGSPATLLYLVYLPQSVVGVS